MYILPQVLTHNSIRNRRFGPTIKHHNKDIKMKDTIKDLRWSWYSNLHIFDENGKPKEKLVYRFTNKYPVNSRKLFDHSIKLASEKYVKMCNGIGG
jgi:hypothetical protein